ncbi:MAG: glycosyltransferase family 2 protein [Tannerella sp.]|jgi:GT2 family glycosyltransferase|nr:glycosyltransferase family 2 protein [Tannerella sp.]
MYDCKLSVIIVPHGDGLPPELCLCSLRAAAGGMDAEIFFAHDGLADGRDAALRARFPEITFPDRPRGMNGVRFVNRLIAQCRGEYILLLHPDTLVGEDCLRTLCFFMDEHAAEAGAAGVKMIDGRGVFLPESRRVFPSPRTLFHTPRGRAGVFADAGRGAVGDMPDRPHRVDAVSDAFVLFSHSALNKTGLLDESLPPEGAYLDIMYRMSAAGYGRFCIPGERILHCGDRQRVRAFYDALLLFCKKYYPEAKTAALLIRLRRRLAILFAKEKERPKTGKRRVLAFCRERHLPEMEAAAGKHLSGVSGVGLWNIDRMRLSDAVADRRVKMQAYTDMAFCYPDIPFGRILLFMDRMPEKNIACHIYLSENRQFISCETA